MHILHSLLKWLFFSVALSIVPLLAGAIITATRGGTASIENSLKHGELLIITVSLCATAVGELIGARKKLPIGHTVSGGGALIILLTSAIYFADTSAAISSQAPLDTLQLKTFSIYLFVSGFICSALCVGLSSEKSN